MVPLDPVAVTLLFDSSSSSIRQFKAKQREEVTAKGQHIASDLRYMKQYVGNACGTIATIHSLANSAEALGLPAESPLGRFLEANRGRGPEEFGAALVDATDLHTASEASAQ